LHDSISVIPNVRRTSTNEPGAVQLHARAGPIRWSASKRRVFAETATPVTHPIFQPGAADPFRSRRHRV